MPGLLAFISENNRTDTSPLAHKSERKFKKATKERRASASQDSDADVSLQGHEQDQYSTPPSREELEQLVRKIDDDGIDFGVVAVWSCDASCDGGIEEVIVVQGPADIA